MTHCYLGEGFSNDQIEKTLNEAKVNYRKSAEVCGEAAAMLAEGKILGWFQGRAEVGARARGGRSSLANPLIRDMRDKLNREVKHREGWRPFCPSLPAEDYATYFGDVFPSDFMILAFPVVEAYRDLIPAAVHVDGTARPQGVRKDSHPRFHELLKKFGDKTGHPVLINTSLNVQGEPIVNAPEHALRCFAGTGIDALFIGDFVAEKRRW